jgi:23S rRNA (pseudouridine1915-N3)-methyltransferase
VKVRVVFVGQRAPDWMNAGFEEYARRLPREWSFDAVGVRSEPRERGRNVAQMLEAEALRIVGACERRTIVVLDERGTALTTTQFAAQLDKWRTAGDDVAFVIGGPDGLALRIKTAASARLALSAMTLPHGLARVLIAEQLYRAYTLMSGHPYHRE